MRRFTLSVVFATIAASPAIAANADDNLCVAASAEKLAAIPSLQVVNVVVANGNDKKLTRMRLVSFDLKFANAGFRYVFECVRNSDGSYFAALEHVE